ncbi:MAG: universal stress protein [Burkholderiales bacterium]
MYQHILVAVDGSPTSERALEEAMGLASALGSRLRLVHAVDEVIWDWEGQWIDPQPLWEAMAKAGRDLLDRLAKRVNAAGLAGDTKLLEITTAGQRVSEAIVAEAEAWPADLIVAGTHGRRGLSHLLLGSVAEGIVRVATRPVLLVRATE